MNSAPIIYQWEGDAMKPMARFAKVCDAQFTIGEHYRLEVIEERSGNSHSHYFVSVSEAWKNLPEDIAERYLTPHHLRKWALIKCGYADERSIVTASKAEALMVAAFIGPMDEHAVIIASECVVTVYTAKSQSYRAMGKETFQQSKEAVLGLLSSMVGVQPSELSENAGTSA